MGEFPSVKDVQSFQLQHEQRQQLQPPPYSPVVVGPAHNMNNLHRSLILDFNTVDEYSTEGLKRIIEATKAFQSLPPAGPLWDLQKSYPEFARAMKNCRTRILPILKTLLEHAKISTNDFKRRDWEEKFDFIVDSNDDILERIATALDEASGLFKRTEILVVNQKPIHIGGNNSKSATFGDAASNNNWAKKKTVDFRDSDSSAIINNKIRKVTFANDDGEETRQMRDNKLATTTTTEASNSVNTVNRPIKKALHRLRVTEKPQIHFKVPIDNSLAPFVPKLKEKPNSLKPLSILPEYNAKNEEFYGHPYNVELNRWEPDDIFLTSVVPKLPHPIDNVPPILVDTTNQLEDMMKELRKVNILGVDLEHHSFRTFLGLTCTIQISTREYDYVIDTLALREDLECLNEVFTHPKVMKILHGAQSDIEWLQRDFGVYIVGLFDTHIAAKHLGLPVLSLQYLLQQYCKINVDKTYQLADWRIRPIPYDMIEYSRQDTHYLPYLYDVLKNQLITNGNQFNNLLNAVYDHSRMICLRRYEKPSNNPQLALRKTRRELNNRQLYAFTNLFKWRDTLAREKDESLGFILPNHMLLMIAESLPKEMTGILSCCDPVPSMVQNNLGDLHRIILQARDLPVHEEKIQLGATGKRKKQKNWVVLLNSIHDINLDDITDMDKEDEGVNNYDDLEEMSTNRPEKHSSVPRRRLESKTSWPEPWDPSCVDISNIRIKLEASTNIFGLRVANSVVHKNTTSSAFERYQLSNEIIEMLKDPKRKEELDLEDPLVRVVYDTLVRDTDATRTLSENTEDVVKHKKQVGKILPDSDFVPFNPMAQELNSFEPPPKKKTKKGRNTHEEWNDGGEYETTDHLPRDFVGAPTPTDEVDEDAPMDEKNEDDEDDNSEIADPFLAMPASKSSKKKHKRAKFLEQLKLKKLMKLKRKKKYELEKLEKEEQRKTGKLTKRDNKEVDIIEIREISPAPFQHGGSAPKISGAQERKIKRMHDAKRKRDESPEDDDDVICLDDFPPAPPIRQSPRRLRMAPPRFPVEEPPVSRNPWSGGPVKQPKQQMFNPVSKYAGFMQKGEVRGVNLHGHPGAGKRMTKGNANSTGANTEMVNNPNSLFGAPPPFLPPGGPQINPNYQFPNQHQQPPRGVAKFLNQFRRPEGKSVTFK